MKSYKSVINGDILYKNYKGQYHREDGPAFINIADGIENWYINGLLHREDGPAMKFKDYFIKRHYWKF